MTSPSTVSAVTFDLLNQPLLFGDYPVYDEIRRARSIC
jgi:hypothetical protein